MVGILANQSKPTASVIWGVVAAGVSVNLLFVIAAPAVGTLLTALFIVGLSASMVLIGRLIARGASRATQALRGTAASGKPYCKCRVSAPRPAARPPANRGLVMLLVPAR